MARKVLDNKVTKKTSNDALKDNLDDYVDEDVNEDIGEIVKDIVNDYVDEEDLEQEYVDTDVEIEAHEQYVEDNDVEEDIVELKKNIKKQTPARNNTMNTNKKEMNSEDKTEKEIFRSLIGEVQKMDKDNQEGYFEKRLKEKDSKTFLNNVRKFLKSDQFEEKCEELSVLHKVDKNKIAESFSQKVIATIADCMGTAIEITYCATTFLINMISCVLKAAIGVICSVANRILGFLSLGYTRTLA